MTTVSDVTTLGGNDFTGETELTLEGFHSPNDGGGGVLILDAAATGTVPGLVFADGATPAPNYFRRLAPTGDVREFGALCDAVIVTTPGVQTASDTFSVATPIDTKYIGAPIVVVGADTGAAPLATTILNIAGGGTSVQLNTAIVTTFPLYVASNVKSISPGSTGYAAGDTCVMSDGTTLIVGDVDNTGTVLFATVYAQSSPFAGPTPTTVSQSSTSGAGTGLSCKLTYTGTGQFAYGSDDSAALANALTYAREAGVDVVIPQDRICGTISTISLPAGAVHLCGHDMWSSGIVALAAMSSVLDRSLGGYGGSVANLFVEGMKVATSAISVVNGRYPMHDNVEARNGIDQEWLIGSVSDNPAGYWNRCDGRTNTGMFGPAGQLSDYNWNIVQAESCRFIACTASGSSQANFICTAGGVYCTSCNFFGGGSYIYDPVYNFDLQSPALVVGCQAGSPKTAAYHVAWSSINLCHNFTQFGSHGYCDPVNTYGVLIEPTATPFFTRDCSVIGCYDDGTLPAENLIHQNGDADPRSVVADNPRATYTTVDPYISWAQPATNAYVNKAARLGAPPMGNARFVLVDDMLAAIGPALLAKADMFYVLAGADEVTALLNIAAPGTYTLTKNGSLTFTADRGYAGDGSTGYLDTVIAVNKLDHFVQNDAALFAWTGDNQSTNGSFAIGTAATNSRYRVNPRDASGKLSVRAQSTTDDLAADADSIGMYGWSRQGGGYALYVDGASVATPGTGTTTLNSTFRFLADGTTFSTRTIQAAWVGAGLTGTEITQLYNAVKTYLTAVGAPI